MLAQDVRQAPSPGPQQQQPAGGHTWLHREQLQAFWANLPAQVQQQFLGMPPEQRQGMLLHLLQQEQQRQ